MYFRILVLLSVLFSFSATAADLFTVDGIKASSSGSTAKQAKDTAVINGQREAFNILLQRIASNSSSSLNIDDDKLANLVQGIEVNDEKVTANYYSATLNISFNKALIEKTLQSSNISFTSKKSAPIVLVPLLIADGQNMLFEEENPLRKALTEIAAANPVLTIIVPVNLRSIDKTKLSQNIEDLSPDSRDALLRLAQNYKAEKLVLIAASGQGGNLNIRMQDIKDASSPIKEISLDAKDAAAGEDIYKFAARGINSVLEGQWVKSKTPNAASLNKIAVTIPITSLNEWLAARKKLASLSFIKEISLKSLTVQYAYIELSVTESLENLSARMAENGLILENIDNKMILRQKGSGL